MYFLDSLVTFQELRHKATVTSRLDGRSSLLEIHFQACLDYKFGGQKQKVAAWEGSQRTAKGGQAQMNMAQNPRCFTYCR